MPAVRALAPLAGEDGMPRVVFPFEAVSGHSTVCVGARSWPCVVRELSGLPREGEARPRAGVTWYAAAMHVVRPPERLSPSSEPLPGAARVISVTALGERRAVTATTEQMGPLGDAIHAFLAADLPGDEGRRHAMATRLLSARGVQGAIEPRILLEASDALRRWLDARYPGAAWRREWPVRARLACEPPRLLVGEVDLCLELPDSKPCRAPPWCGRPTQTCRPVFFEPSAGLLRAVATDGHRLSLAERPRARRGITGIVTGAWP